MAKRWFVPDYEFYYTAEDYAVVSETASYIRVSISAYDSETQHQWADSPNLYIRSWLQHLRVYPGCYGFTQQGRLVYADVNENDPKHKQEVYGKLAKEVNLGKESKKATAAKEKIVAFLKASGGSCYEDNSNGGSEDDVLGLDSEEAKLGSTLQHAIWNAELEPDMVDYIIQLKNKDDIQAILNVFSRQSRRKAPRPVMLLVGMIDSGQVNKSGQTEGWAVGYDFLKGLLIIKPFISKQGHHPLGEKWDDKVAGDGVSFVGTPAVFVENFIKLCAQPNEKTEIDGLKLLVHIFVAEWIVQQWKGFATVEPNAWTDESRKSVKAAKKNIETVISKRTVVIKEKTGGRKRPLLAFEKLADKLVIEEDRFRGSALEAREKGNEKAAQNAAVLYELLTKNLKSFNENPENKL